MLGGEGLVRGISLPGGGRAVGMFSHKEEECWEERGGSEVFHALGLGVFNHLEGGGTLLCEAKL